VERYSVERPTVELARDVLRSKPDVFLSLAPWVFILKPLTTIPIVASMPDPYQDGLQGAGDLFYTWQHKVQSAFDDLRREGKLLPKARNHKGPWRLD